MESHLLCLQIGQSVSALSVFLGNHSTPSSPCIKRGVKPLKVGHSHFYEYYLWAPDMEFTSYLMRWRHNLQRTCFAMNLEWDPWQCHLTCLSQSLSTSLVCIIIVATELFPLCYTDSFVRGHRHSSWATERFLSSSTIPRPLIFWVYDLTI